ncbi:MAG: bifunctional diaminohydroxyphosphoribosylaminopyrimidine deaminase/5-amino-6-(5-phosphoribosylamino)uracil reductase RibD [Fuerstia sp.]|nr:bifunctional diaminohydroxyphosphoribosylaminopyrimidine deaminase/5-amino-6-(5-phosphoribosylamino)uracil reductase RibD [Fuerstiella sp.]
MTSPADPVALMQLALQHARHGEGYVEPNPMVGAVVATAEGTVISTGHHQRFGEPHAEINAIRAAGSATVGNDLYVTLEPCSHFGKTPPCADAVIKAGFRRVFVGCQDPAPHVAGQGIQRLRNAGLEVTVGVCETESRRLVAPFVMLMLQRRPWIHAKWAMTLDGRIASRTGHSEWISSDASRALVHQLRGRMDAIITGAGTVRSDDPLLTARPAGPRTPLRVVIDADGLSLHADTNLIKSLSQGSVLVCVADDAATDDVGRLKSLGVEVAACAASEPGRIDLRVVMAELGRRGCTNVLTEAGSGILGSLFDSSLIDEVHIFIAPRLIGGASAHGPIGGLGRESIPAIPNVKQIRHTSIGDDLLIEGDVCRE